MTDLLSLLAHLGSSVVPRSVFLTHAAAGLRTGVRPGARRRILQRAPGTPRRVPGRALAQGRAALPAAHRGSEAKTRSEEHTSELQSRLHLVCRLLLEKKKVIALLLVCAAGIAADIPQRPNFV